MKKLLLIAGVAFIFACVLSLLYAGLNLYGYYHALDGSSEFYARLHRRAVVWGGVGVVFATLGTALVVIYSKI